MVEFDALLNIGLFKDSLREQQAVLRDFWKKAGHVLSGSGVDLKPIPKRWTTLRHNYFSVLFIAVFFSLGIPTKRLRLYGRMNHCLRAWVTSCDNLLDEELKEMLKTDLPEGAKVFKSVHTLLVTDRVFFSFLLDAVSDGIITYEEMDRLIKLSLSALTASGIEEASEEAGADYSLSPEDVLENIHSLKSGKLFSSPLAAPSALGDIKDKTALESMRKGLYHLGIACQILDDMNDIGEDLSRRKHNYLISLILHGRDTQERELISGMVRHAQYGFVRHAHGDGILSLSKDGPLYRRFPAASEKAQAELKRRFMASLELLSGGGLPLGKAGRASLVRGLMILFKRPELIERMRSI